MDNLSSAAGFRMCPGLPPYGPGALAFPRRFGPTGREGIVVEFSSGTPEAWVGNFAPGHGSHSGAYLHPNGSDVVVFAAGQGYVIDPRKRKLKEEIGGEVEHLWPVDDPPGLVLDRQGIAFFRIGPRGTYWHTRRLSWDGFKDLSFSSTRIVGLAWTPIGESWLPFEVDVATGRSSGGAYSSVDAERWEKLAKP